MTVAAALFLLSGGLRTLTTSGISRRLAQTSIKFTRVALALATLTLATPATALELHGEPTQGGLLIARTTPGAQVTIDDRRTRVSPQGYFLLGFHRDETGPARIVVTQPDGTTETRTVEVTKRQYKEQRVDGLPESKVTPSAKNLARIKKENAMVARARTLDAARTEFLAEFQWPAHGPITGIYGSRRILNGKPRRPHFGIDIAAPAGAPVRAPAGGVVTLAHPDMFFSGGTLIIDHGHGLSSTFIHLKRILVKKGQAVKQGDPIAEVGSTGRSTGAHLDWRINLFNKRLDPQLLVGEMPEG